MSPFSFFIFFGLTLVACQPVPDLDLGDADSDDKKKSSQLKFDDTSLGGKRRDKRSRSNGNSPSPNVDNSVASLEAFQKTVFPILRQNTCVACHGNHQGPKFAVADVSQAFTNLTSAGKVDLVDPERSRIVRKIVDQSHNCWGNCAENSQTMLDAVIEWKNLVGQNGAQQGIGRLQTNSLPFPRSRRPAQTEHGTVIIQAEQEFPGVIRGRYRSFVDSNALGQKYIKGPRPPVNPLTETERIDSVTVNGCVEPTLSQINDQINGAYRVRETFTHIPSGNIKSATTNRDVYDGFLPYSYKLIGRMVRPDRRLQWAQMLLDQNFTNLGDVLLKAGRILPQYTRNNQGVAEALPKQEGDYIHLLEGGDVSYADTTTSGSVRILPHFAKWVEVFDSNGNFKPSSSFFEDDQGNSVSLYRLFEGGAYSPSLSTILKELKEDEKIKQQLLYPIMKRDFQAEFNGRDRDKILFNRIERMSLKFFLSTQQIDIKLSCRDEWNGKEAELLDPDRPEKGYKNCNPNTPNFPGRQEHLRFKVLTPESSIEPLNYQNALDKMTLSASGQEIVMASNSQIASGQWFHRMDLFQAYDISFLAKSSDDFINRYLKSNTNGFSSNESFSRDTSAPGGGNLEYDMESNPRALDLSAIYIGGAASLDQAKEIDNFSAALFPVIQSARCIDCHSNGSQVRFAEVNPALAMQTIKDAGLVKFSDPSDSFRGRARGMVHNCNMNSNDPRYNCENDNQLRMSIIGAIQDWKSLNEADASGLPYKTLSIEERTPGTAEYEINITEPGYYNVWMRLKKREASQGSSEIHFEIKDPTGNKLRYWTVENGQINQSSQTCDELDVGGANWRWMTNGRGNASIGDNDEKLALDFKGYRLKDNDQNIINLPDNRRYWRLGVGIHRLKIFETETNMAIDLVALSKVENPLIAEDRLKFQPDLRTSDEKYISNYKRNILRYDLRPLLPLAANEQAFFEIEVEKEFGGQNYIFKAPRFTMVSPAGRRIAVAGIRGMINGKHEFTDATYSQIDYVVGVNRAMTYAPLLSLVPDPDNSSADTFSFAFDKLELTNSPLSEINPNKDRRVVREERECLELDLFVKTVKPILKNVKVALNEDYWEAMDMPAPGNNVGPSLRTYNCISCHTSEHKYFKMTEFDYNDDYLCRQAISRVDFTNFYQSMIVRGINGTDDHPKFYFQEELMYENGSQRNWATHDGGNDYLQGFYRNPAGIKSKLLRGPFAVFSKQDLQIPANANFSSLSPQQKERVPAIGSYKKIKPVLLPTDSNLIGGYDPILHGDLLGTIRSQSDIVDPNFVPNIDREDREPLYIRDRARRAGPMMYYPHTSSNVFVDVERSAINFEENGNNYGGLTPLYEKTTNNKISGALLRYNNGNLSGGQGLDFRSDLPGKNSRQELESELERLRTKYREAVINWIRAEDAAYKANN